jgi:hypothetical protein
MRIASLHFSPPEIPELFRTLECVNAEIDAKQLEAAAAFAEGTDADDLDSLFDVVDGLNALAEAVTTRIAARTDDGAL